VGNQALDVSDERGRILEMHANSYQELAARTLIHAPGFNISDVDLMIIWTALGLAGEAGEVAELAKKGVFHQHGIDKERFVKELGDCLWYIAGICTKLNLNLSDVMQDNIEKLKLRYPDGFSSDASIARVDMKVK
jgi:NTP pyrophosphatase (non-canonical NTP hydrolase)